MPWLKRQWKAFADEAGVHMFWLSIGVVLTLLTVWLEKLIFPGRRMIGATLVSRLAWLPGEALPVLSPPHRRSRRRSGAPGTRRQPDEWGRRHA
jgi:hypothetical protein